MKLVKADSLETDDKMLHDTCSKCVKRSVCLMLYIILYVTWSLQRWSECSTWSWMGTRSVCLSKCTYVCVNYDSIFVPAVVTSRSPKPAGIQVLLLNSQRRF